MLDFWKKEIFRKCGLKISTLEDFADIPSWVISKIIREMHSEGDEQENVNSWNSKVAPEGLILDDFMRTRKNSDMMFLPGEMAQYFNVRAIQGHAQNGDGSFQSNGFKYVYPNTTTADVLDSLDGIALKGSKKKFSKERFQNKSQVMNDNIVYFMEDWFEGMKKNFSNIKTRSRVLKLRDRVGNPINGMKCFKATDVDVLEFARGFFLGGNMDSLHEVRDLGFAKYFFHPGGGESHLASTGKLQQYGIDISHMSKINYSGIFKILNYVSGETRLKTLEDLGVISRKRLLLEEIAMGEFSWDKIRNHSSSTDLFNAPGHWSQYIREIKGQGIGDDIVVWLAEFLPPSIYREGRRESGVAMQSRILGALLADQMDTLEKDARFFIPGGQDKIAAKHINGLYRSLAKEKRFRDRFGIRERGDDEYNLLDESELVDFSMAGANIGEDNIHSSQRWFYLVKDNTCALSEYLKYACYCGRALGKDICFSDLRGFKIDPNKDPSGTRFTFRNIPLGDIRRVMKERLDLIVDPCLREDNLKNYYISKLGN